MTADLPEGLHKGGDVVDDSMPQTTEPVPGLDEFDLSPGAFTRTLADLAARIEVLTSERDRAREDAGHHRHMREYLSSEMSGWIKRHTEAQAEIESLRGQLRAERAQRLVRTESHFRRVFEWMRQASMAGAAHQGVHERPFVPPDAVKELRKRLVAEEYNELMAAIDADDLVEIADACADLDVVVAGTAVAYGIDHDAVFDEVMRANFTKLIDGLIDEGGKVQKGPSYVPPNVSAVLDRQLRRFRT